MVRKEVSKTSKISWGRGHTRNMTKGLGEKPASRLTTPPPSDTDETSDSDLVDSGKAD